MINIKIGDKEYKVQEAKTNDEKIIGLQNITELPDNEGMLFYYEEPQNVTMWMHETKIPLDIIFIDEDQKVIYIYKGDPESKKKITIPNTSYVLEVNINSGIKKGDNLEFLDDEEPPVMKVLAPDGSEQMGLWGGERIFSRIFTKQLIKIIKKADSLKNDEEQYNKSCKTIGKKMFRELQAQTDRNPEYVQLPE